MGDDNTERKIKQEIPEPHINTPGIRSLGVVGDKDEPIPKKKMKPAHQGIYNGCLNNGWPLDPQNTAGHYFFNMFRTVGGFVHH